jgi:hypothetical protein
MEFSLLAVGFSYQTPAGDFHDYAPVMADHRLNGVRLGRQYRVLARDVRRVLSVDS